MVPWSDFLREMDPVAYQSIRNCWIQQVHVHYLWDILLWAKHHIAWLSISKSKKKHFSVSVLLSQAVILNHTLAPECLSGIYGEYLWFKYYQIIPLLHSGEKQNFGYNEFMKRNNYRKSHNCDCHTLRQQGLTLCVYE